MGVLTFTDVAFSFGRRRFIDRLSFSAVEGEVIGLVGANGAGKSTVLRLAAGLLKPREGTVSLRGRPVAAYRGRERARLVAYLPQNLDAGLPFRVAELVRMGEYPRSGLPRLGPENALRMVGLEGKARAPLDELSGGERRRAFIAMTLVQGAGCLLLDEPLAGLDLKYQAQLLRLLREITKNCGVTVLLSLHDMAAASGLDRLLALKEGLLVAEGPPSSVLSQDLVRELFDLQGEEVSLLYPPGDLPLGRDQIPGTGGEERRRPWSGA